MPGRIEKSGWVASLLGASAVLMAVSVPGAAPALPLHILPILLHLLAALMVLAARVWALWLALGLAVYGLAHGAQVSAFSSGFWLGPCAVLASGGLTLLTWRGLAAVGHPELPAGTVLALGSGLTFPTVLGSVAQLPDPRWYWGGVALFCGLSLLTALPAPRESLERVAAVLTLCAVAFCSATMWPVVAAAPGQIELATGDNGVLRLVVRRPPARPLVPRAVTPSPRERLSLTRVGVLRAPLDALRALASAPQKAPDPCADFAWADGRLRLDGQEVVANGQDPAHCVEQRRQAVILAESDGGGAYLTALQRGTATVNWARSASHDQAPLGLSALSEARLLVLVGTETTRSALVFSAMSGDLLRGFDASGLSLYSPGLLASERALLRIDAGGLWKASAEVEAQPGCLPRLVAAAPGLWCETGAALLDPTTLQPLASFGLPPQVRPAPRPAELGPRVRLAQQVSHSHAIDPAYGVRIDVPPRSSWVVSGEARARRRGGLALLQATDWRRSVSVEVDVAAKVSPELAIRQSWGPGRPLRCVPDRFGEHAAVRCDGLLPGGGVRSVTGLGLRGHIYRLVVSTTELDDDLAPLREMVTLTGGLPSARTSPGSVVDATGADWRVTAGTFVSDAHGLTASPGSQWVLQVDPWLPGRRGHGVLSLKSRNPDVVIAVLPEVEASGGEMTVAGRASLAPDPGAPAGVARHVGRLYGHGRQLGLVVWWWVADSTRAERWLRSGLRRLAVLPHSAEPQGPTALSPSFGPSHRLDETGFVHSKLNIRWTRQAPTLWRVRHIQETESAEVLRFAHAGYGLTASLQARRAEAKDGALFHAAFVSEVLEEQAMEAETNGVVLGGLSAWETRSAAPGGSTHLITALDGGIAYSLVASVPESAREGALRALSQLHAGLKLSRPIRGFEVGPDGVQDHLMGYALKLPDGWDPASCTREPGVGVACKAGRSEVAVTVTPLGDPFVNLDEAWEALESGFRRFLLARELEATPSAVVQLAGRRAHHFSWRPGDGLQAHELRFEVGRTMFGLSIVSDDPVAIQGLRDGFRLLER